jgi:hypothetical protein
MSVPSLVVFKVNLALWDRAIRILIGVLLLANLNGRFGGTYIFDLEKILNIGELNLVAAFLGLLLIITAALGHCPIYSLLKISTAK